MKRFEEQRSTISLLTTSQIDLLARVAEFRSSRQIAHELGISRHTVDQRIKTIVKKMCVDTRAEAARAFLESTNGFMSRFSNQIETSEFQITGNDAGQDFKPLGRACLEQSRSTAQADMQTKVLQACYRSDETQVPMLPKSVLVLRQVASDNGPTALGRILCLMLTLLLVILVAGALVGLAEELSLLFSCQY